MRASEIIGAFCRAVGVPAQTGKDGTLSFDSDGMMLWIHVLDEIDSIVLVGDLGEAAPGRLEKLYRAILEAQHLFKGTFGATVSVNPETGRFSLCKAFSCRGLEPERFIAEAEHFLSIQESWRKIIRDYHPAAAEADSGEAIGGMGMLRV